MMKPSISFNGSCLADMAGKRITQNMNFSINIIIVGEDDCVFILILHVVD